MAGNISDVPEKAVSVVGDQLGNGVDAVSRSLQWVLDNQALLLLL